MSDQKPLGADAAAVDRAGSIASDAATARHTPGPWGWDSRNTNYYLLSFADDAPHHIVMEVKQLPKDEYGTADACLIAAAPDLLEALKDCVEFQGCGDPDCCEAARAQVLARQRARAVIAKAEGR